MSVNKNIRQSIYIVKILRFVLVSILMAYTQTTIAQVSYTQHDQEQAYRKATELMEQHNYATARVMFQNFLEQANASDLRRPEAEYNIAHAALKLQSEQSEELITTFLQEHPQHPLAPTARFDLANYFYDAQKYAKAIEYYTSADFNVLPPDEHTRSKFRLGYSYFNERKLAEALPLFNQVKFDNHTYTAAANYYAGFIHYSEARYDEALADLKRAEVNQAYSAVVPYLIASVYYRKKQYTELLAYTASLETNENIKNRKEMMLLVAEADYAKADYAKAVIAYDEALNKTTADPGVLYRAGLSHYKVGNNETSIQLLEQAAASADMVAPVASFQLGILYLQISNKQYALNAFDRARKASDKEIAEQAQFNYAKIAYDIGQSDKAITELERYLSLYPKAHFATETKELLAQAYINGNNFNKAIEYIEALTQKSTPIKKAYQKAAFLKGSEFFNKDNYTEAIIYFAKSLEYPIDEKYVQQATFWSAEIKSIQRNYPEAQILYERSIQSGATDRALQFQAHYGLGYALYNQKQYDKSLVQFKKMIDEASTQNPNYADALLRLADCYYIGKQYDMALQTYLLYKQIGLTDLDYAYLQLGLIYGVQRKYDESHTQFSTLISKFPSSRYRAESMYQRAQFSIERGNYQEAVEGLSQLIKSEPTSAYTPYAYSRRAASFFNLKNYEQTVNDYVSVVNLYPAHTLAQEVLIPLQEALSLIGRSDEFGQYLTVVKKANPDNKGIESLEFETAKKLYFSEQYEKAITELQIFIQSYSQSTFLLEANYYQAESYYRLRKYSEALQLYDQLKLIPTFVYAARVAARLADITFRMGNYQQAVVNYHYLQKYVSAKKDIYTTLSGLMESFYLLAQYDSCDVYARQILQQATTHAGAENKATLYLGKSAMARGDYDSAEDEFINVINTARDEYGAEAKYQLATIFFLRKDYKQCYETLISLNTDFVSFQIWVGKSYLLLSDNFLAQKDVFQAKATLQSLVDNFPLQTIREEAIIKLKAIEQQETPRADTVQVGEQ